MKNISKLGKALEKLKISTQEFIEQYEFVPGWIMLNLSNGYALEVSTSMKGLEYMSFQECYDLASTAEIEGIFVKFLHFNYLIESKKAANRPKDQIDILALEEIKKEREKG